MVKEEKKKKSQPECPIMANIAKERERIRVADLIDKVRAENR